MQQKKASARGHKKSRANAFPMEKNYADKTKMKSKSQAGRKK
jgi:hypothetical protein